MPTLPDATRVSYATLLAAYQAEPQGGTDRLIYAQHVVERLVVEDVFGRLARLRADLADKSDRRDLGVVIDCALFELDTILGEA
jgi:hypothetical protein